MSNTLYKAGLLKKSGKQKGFTLAELTVVLLIGSLLAAAAILGLPRILSNIRADKVIDTMTTGVPAIQTAYANKASFSGLTTAIVANNRYLDNFIDVDATGKPAGTITSNWGSIEFAAVASPRTTALNGAVQATIENVPARECSRIADLFSNEVISTAHVGTTSVKAAGAEVDLSAVGVACSAATSTKGVDMIFTFERA